MTEADRITIASGISGPDLMEKAGLTVADAISLRWKAQPVTLLCGPGNNGGDGFVIARLLAQRGWPVRLALLGQVNALTGDAAHHAAAWTGPVEPLSPECVREASLVVDAVFGAGLSRLEGHQHHRRQSGLHLLEGEERAELPRTPQARGVGGSAEHKHLLAGHDVDREHLQSVGDVVLVDADLHSRR